MLIRAGDESKQQKTKWRKIASLKLTGAANMLLSNTVSLISVSVFLEPRSVFLQLLHLRPLEEPRDSNKAAK